MKEFCDMENPTVKKNKRQKPKAIKEIVSKGVYENGKIKLNGKNLPKRRMNVVVTFREASNEVKKNNEKIVDSFIKKWSGLIKEENVEMVMEKKLEYLVEKNK